MARDRRSFYMNGSLAEDEREYEYDPAQQELAQPARRARRLGGESVWDARLRARQEEEARLAQQRRDRVADLRRRARRRRVLKAMAATAVAAGVCILLIAGQLAIVRNNRAIARQSAQLKAEQAAANDLSYELAAQETLQEVEAAARQMGMVYAADGETHLVTLPEKAASPDAQAGDGWWQRLRAKVLSWLG